MRLDRDTLPPLSFLGVGAAFVALVLYVVHLTAMVPGSPAKLVLAAPDRVTVLIEAMLLSHNRYWLVVLSLLGAAVIAFVFYSRIDGWFVALSGREVPPGTRWHIVTAAIFGAVSGVMMVFFQERMEAYLEAPLLWPAGHGTLMWIFWSMWLVFYGLLVGIIIQSVWRLGPAVGAAQAALLVTLCTLLAVTLMILTAWVVLLAVLAVVALIMFSAMGQQMNTKTTLVDRQGNEISSGWG